MWFIAALIAALGILLLPAARHELERKRFRRQVLERERARGYAGRQ